MTEQGPRVVVLLGAGASADAGIPTTIGMTDAIIHRMNDPVHARALEYIRHTLAADTAVREQYPAGIVVDVERLFASIELLIDRYTQPWSPFVLAWSPGLESFSTPARVRERDLQSSLSGFDDAVRSMIPDPRTGHTRGFGFGRRDQLSRMIAKAITQAFGRARPTELSSILEGARAEMLSALLAVLAITDSTPLNYLDPLFGLVERQGSLAVATLNYDLTVEEAARRHGVRCDTGLETWLSRGKLRWPERDVSLFKLHGSIDWMIYESHQRGELPLKKVQKAGEDIRGYPEPAIVFGEAGKLRAEGPYIELLLAWSGQLQNADVLLIIGYSFRDQHVNEMIARWFNASPKRRIILLDPSDPGASYSAGPPTFAQSCALVDRITGDDQGPPPLRRFVHVAANAEDGMQDAVAAASAWAEVA
jgi:SIR2-like domain